jgi:hypothetical protein
LSAEEFFCGARETALASYGQEDFELREFHVEACGPEAVVPPGLVQLC